MADEIRTVDSKSVVDSVKQVCTGENLQKYILGTKKNGAPRAIYDIVKDFAKPSKKKKKKKKKKNAQPSSMYDFYVGVKKKKKKHKKKKHWKYD